MTDHEVPAPAARPKGRAEKTEELQEVLAQLRARQQARANGDLPPSPGPRKRTDSAFFARPAPDGNESFARSTSSDRNEREPAIPSVVGWLSYRLPRVAISDQHETSTRTPRLRAGVQCPACQAVGYGAASAPARGVFRRALA
jgi:hypothetical protein